MFWGLREGFMCYQITTIGYDAPIMWMTAVAAFLFFKRLQPPAWLTRAVCFLGPSMFGVYLFHESPMRVVLYQLPETWLSDNCPWMPTAVILLGCAAFTFAVSLGVDLLRRAGLAGSRWAWVRAAGRRAR